MKQLKSPESALNNALYPEIRVQNVSMDQLSMSMKGGLSNLLKSNNDNSMRMHPVMSAQVQSVHTYQEGAMKLKNDK